MKTGSGGRRFYLLLLALLLLGGSYVGSFTLAKQAAARGETEKAEKLLIFGSLYDRLDPDLREYLSAVRAYEQEDWYTAGPVFARLGDYLDAKNYYELCLDAVTVKTEDIRFYRSSVSLTIGDEYSLGAVVFPENASNKTVEYCSADESIVTVEGSRITAVGVGEADVLAMQGEQEFSRCRIIVGHIEPTEMFFKHRYLSGKVGGTAEYEIVFEPTDTSDLTVELSVDNPKIAVIEGSEIRCLSAGTANVTVLHPATGLESTCELVVSAAD